MVNIIKMGVILHTYYQYLSIL